MTTTGDAAPVVESALIVALPELEPVVARHRWRLDPSAVRGVPAHVTVLYPFLPDPTSAELARAEAAVASVRRFDTVLAGTRWFGDDVLWVAPSPAEPFVSLTRALCEAFPALAPYGGAFSLDDVVPHATVGDRTRATSSLDELRVAEVQVQRDLPCTSSVSEVLLMRGTTERQSWTVLHRMPLG